MDEAFKAMALEIGLVVFALLQEGFLDFLDGQPVVALVQLDFVVSIVIIFFRLGLHHALNQPVDCPVVVLVVLLVLDDAEVVDNVIDQLPKGKKVEESLCLLLLLREVIGGEVGLLLDVGVVVFVDDIDAVLDCVQRPPQICHECLRLDEVRLER